MPYKFQAKDVPTLQLLRFIYDSPRAWVDRWSIEEFFVLFPPKVLRAKLDRLKRKGYLDGCTCGCIGDFELTPAGEAWLNASTLKGL